MSCPQCGRSNRRNVAFCDACGTKLPGGAATMLTSPAFTGMRAQSGEEGLQSEAVRQSASAADGIFVGPQAELSALQVALEDALAGRGRLVLLVGEPGIGKTRTAREFARHAGSRGLWCSGDGALKRPARRLLALGAGDAVMGASW